MQNFLGMHTIATGWSLNASTTACMQSFLLFVSFSLLPAGLSFHFQLMKLLHFLLLLYAIISTTTHRGTYAYSIQVYYQYSMIYLHYSTLSATSSSSMTDGTAVRLFRPFLAKLQRIWRDVSIRREREWGGGRERHNGNKRVRGAKCSNFHTISLFVNLIEPHLCNIPRQLHCWLPWWSRIMQLIFFHLFIYPHKHTLVQ